MVERRDIVTGKRYWAHGAHGDVDPGAPAVLYWFKLVRGKGATVSAMMYAAAVAFVIYFVLPLVQRLLAA